MSQPDLSLTNSIDVKRKSAFLEKWFLQQIFKAMGPLPIRFAIKDGEQMSPPGVSPIATVLIRDRRTLAQLALDPEIAFAEAYADGRIELTGNLVRFMEVVYQAWPSGRASRSWYARLTSHWMEWRQANTLDGSRQNIHEHYDLGNDFYKLWLDSQLVYTCAYFPTPSASLEEAQRAKMDHICRKLRLRPGETVVEAGCGWGAFALHMARHYGVRVKAFNISREQIAHARRRAVEEGLDKRVEFIEADYRNISEECDVFVSVGMLEHVGARYYGDLGEVIYRCIGDSGRGLLHFIGRNYKEEFSRWIRKRIFPGAYAPSLREVMDIFEPRNYSVLDVENLRPHYAKTLEHWLERFEKSRSLIAEKYDPWFQRAWELYLAGSVAGFRAGSLQLFQITFAGSASQSIPWTRAPIYEDAKCTHVMS